MIIKANDKIENVLVFEVSREAYGIDQLTGAGREVTTIGDLKRFIEVEKFDDDVPIIFSHDRGYTYGNFDLKNYVVFERNEDGELEENEDY